MLALIHEIGGDPEVRRHEVGVHAERLAVLRDRFVEAAHLEQEFGVGVVGIGIVGNQLDVFLESLLRVRVVALLAVGVSEDVVDRREVGSEFRGFLVVRDGLLVFLLAEVVAAEIEERALIVRIGGNQLVEIFLLLDDFAVGGGLVDEDEQALAFRRLAGQRDCLVQCSKNSLAVAALLARANSAEAKSGSSARALSKCAIESCACSFSARSRPARNSFLASSDLVVTGILPPSTEAAADCPTAGLVAGCQTDAANDEGRDENPRGPLNLISVAWEHGISYKSSLHLRGERNNQFFPNTGHYPVHLDVSQPL